MKKLIFIGVTIICTMSLSACVMPAEMRYVQEAEGRVSEDWQSDYYFFPEGTTSQVYKAAFAGIGPQQEEVTLYITEVQAFEEGTLYELKIDSDVEAPDTHAGYRGDWRDFGLFYVQEDEIYFIRAKAAKDEYKTVDEILKDGTKVCSEAGEEDALGEDERGWHEFILADGDRREYHGYSTLVETGYYEHFFWEKGKGLVKYESGYGASADSIEMYLVEKKKPVTNPYSELNVPTYIIKIGDLYFLVDCYHNQILYHDNLCDPLTDWFVMTDQIGKGHTLAGDGLVYLADDTDNNRILVFERQGDVFVQTQMFSDVGNRPHYIIYDQPTGVFYAWSSMSGEMYLFRRDPQDNRVYLSEIRRVEQLDNVYVRSFTILDDEIYFVSGNSNILKMDLNTFELLEAYPVPDSMAGMIQLTRIQDYYYITVSTDITGNQDYATILRTRDLSAIAQGEYEDIYENFIGGGTPYYITAFDDVFYLTEHRIPWHSVWRFRVLDNEVVDVETIY